MHHDTIQGADTWETGFPSALRDILAAAPAGLFVFDAEGRVLAANPAGRALLGVADGPLPPEAWLRGLLPHARATFRAHVERVLEGGGPEACEVAFAPEEGPVHHVLVRSARVAEAGGPPRCCSVCVDASAPRAREEALAGDLARAEGQVREKTEFMARLSHEVRSALASIVGFAELLRQEADGDRRELADVIRISGRHLLDTLNAVMDLARLDVQEGPVERMKVDVVARVGERVSVLRPLAQARGLSLEWRPDDAHAFALVNPTFLDRIVHNLIDNALKYTPEGRVEVSVEARDAFVWVYVADTGIGIDPAFLPRVFTPFERERSGAEAAEGVGLGLAITRSLVERMGGQIYACSTKGEGSTFTVRFPEAQG